MIAHGLESDDNPGYRRVSVKSRKLIDIRDDEFDQCVDGSFRAKKGVLARVFPNADATQEHVAIARRHLGELGVMFRMMPRPPHAEVVNEEQQSTTSTTAREVISTMVEESHSKRKPELLAYLMKHCDEADL